MKTCREVLAANANSDTHRVRPKSARLESVSELRDVTTPVPRVLLSIPLAGPAPSGNADTPGLGRADTTRTRGISQRDRLPSAHPALLLQGRRQNGSHLLLNQRLTAHVDRGSAVEGRIGRRAVHRHKSGFMPGEEPLAETSIRLVRIRAATYPVGEPAAPASHFCCGPSRWTFAVFVAEVALA